MMTFLLPFRAQCSADPESRQTAVWLDSRLRGNDTEAKEVIE